MEWLKIIIFEFLFGFGLQGFAIVLGIYAFTKQKLVVKDYILSSFLVLSVSYFVRLLPISFGIHTLLNMLFLFLICIIILKMPAYSTIRASFIVTMLLLICEMIDVAVMIVIFGKEKFESLMLMPLAKALIGFPASIMFLIITSLAYYISNKSNKRVIDDGNTCK